MSTRASEGLLALAVLLVPSVVGANDVDLPREERACPVPAVAPAPPLRLAWIDVTGLGRGVEGIARSEIQSILDDAGIDTAWRRARPGEIARPDEVRIVLVDRLLVSRVSGRPVLGSSPDGSRRHPLVWVHLQSVQTALRLKPGSSATDLSPGPRRDLGLALGRVVVHEVVHALAPTLRHGRGLMSERLARGDLAGPRPFVEPRVVRAVRLALRGPAWRASSPIMLAGGVTSPWGGAPACVSAEAKGSEQAEPKRGRAR